MGKAIPYGVLDIGANEGWVNVGDDHDTPAFAVASIARWWQRMGKPRYPDATRLMITADAGGSNGYRSTRLQGRTGQTGRDHRADHHRLPHAAGYLEVEQNRTPPLQLHLDELARQDHSPPTGPSIELIAATTTRTGLRVEADLDTGHYPDRGQDHRQATRAPCPSNHTTGIPTGTTRSSHPKRSPYCPTDP